MGILEEIKTLLTENNQLLKDLIEKLGENVATPKSSDTETAPKKRAPRKKQEVVEELPVKEAKQLEFSFDPTSALTPEEQTPVEEPAPIDVTLDDCRRVGKDIATKFAKNNEGIGKVIDVLKANGSTGKFNELPLESYERVYRELVAILEKK